MANNKTLWKAIERCEKRIAQAENKKRWSQSILDRDKADETIIEQRHKMLLLEQQVRFNNATRTGNANKPEQ